MFANIEETYIQSGDPNINNIITLIRTSQKQKAKINYDNIIYLGKTYARTIKEVSDLKNLIYMLRDTNPYAYSTSTFNGFGEYGDFWSELLKPVKRIGSDIERQIIRPTIGAEGIGAPIGSAAKWVENRVIDPVLKPLIKPVADVMPKITIDGHRYDLGGHQMLQKAATGAVAGFAAGGVYGAVAGGIVAALIPGKPNVMNNLITGASVGYAAGNIATYYTSTIGETGMTAAQMSAAGATDIQIAEIAAASSAEGGLAANGAMLEHVGTIGDTGMTAGEMAAAGATDAQISEAIASSVSNTLNTPIPGTGMTGQEMLDAGATPQQVQEITVAANAPGGIGNPANASLMPSVGQDMIAQGSITPADLATPGGGITSGEIIAGTTAATGVIGAGTQLATIVQGPQEQAEQPLRTGGASGIFSEINLPLLIGGLAVLVLGTMIIKKKKA